jgi:2-dehydro-3-deoxyphosphogluconate aldolase/(4S)-4-hydroxy-2-oxoglutarate aldolase
MNAILEQLGKIGLVPVIAINDVSKAVPLARALVAGGIPCAEVTFRTAEAEGAMKAITDAGVPILLGAGTVLTTDQVDRAVDAGAKFIVSPGLNPKVVAYCVQKGIPITPGCANASDVEQAMENGLDVVKFFPAEQAGGLDYLKAIAAPYTTMKFMPTGGINAANVAKYAAWPRIHAIGGSWMVKGDLINAGAFDTITSLCREALLAMLGFRILHVGINAANADEAVKGAKVFAAMFGMPVMPTNISVFAGSAVEIMSGGGRGTHGHICIATNSAPKAIGYFERNGFALDPASVGKAADGHINFIYFKDEVLGFAVHIKEA